MIAQFVETPVRLISRSDDMSEFTVAFIDIPNNKPTAVVLKAEQERRGNWKSAALNSTIYVSIPKAVADFYHVNETEIPGYKAGE